MKRSTFIILFIACNIGIILLQIRHHTVVVQELYRKQRNEKTKDELLQKKAAATRSLYALKNPTMVKQFATEELKMQKICLHQIKTVTKP